VTLKEHSSWRVTAYSKCHDSSARSRHHHLWISPGPDTAQPDDTFRPGNTALCGSRPPL